MRWPRTLCHPFWPSPINELPTEAAEKASVEKQPAGGPAVGVGLIDVLFGLVLGDIFKVLAGTPIHKLPRWTELMVALSVLTLSWIGFHKTRAFDPRDVSFIDKVSLQYVIDMGIIGLYFALAQAAQTGTVKSITSMTALLAVIAALYLAWDVIGSRFHEKHSRAQLMAHERAPGSLVLTVVFTVAAVVARVLWKPMSDVSTITWGLVVFSTLLWYRRDQNLAENEVKRLWDNAKKEKAGA